MPVPTPNSTTKRTTRSVWKYPLPFPGKDSFQILMPAGARVLTVQMQGNQPCLWALVEPETKNTDRHFRIAGTGHPIDEHILGYVGTFQMMSGALVFHLFEVDRE